MKLLSSPYLVQSNEVSIYNSLAQHQRNEIWFGQQIIATLQEWAERFNDKFKLDIPQIVLRVDLLSRSCYGHFRKGYNGLGLLGEIAINARYINERQPWEILGTLLHESLHAWQQAHGEVGKGHYHNTEFRKKAREFGLVIDREGVTRYEIESRFMDLLHHYGITTPKGCASGGAEESKHSGEEVPEKQRTAGTSKLKKWTCGCGMNVRCARADLCAQCLKCGQLFKQQV